MPSILKTPPSPTEIVAESKEPTIPKFAVSGSLTSLISLPFKISSGVTIIISLSKAITTDTPDGALLTAAVSSASLLTTVLEAPNTKGETALNIETKQEKTNITNNKETKNKTLLLHKR
ncbi:MAG: hypothetical protein LBH79_05005 [Nitrososphaerota archaeon]|nr:hypothetical protein [Nitrososphaerota archaeon]